MNRSTASFAALAHCGPTSVQLIKGAQAIYYPGAPHGLTTTLQDKVNADLLAF